MTMAEDANMQTNVGANMKGHVATYSSVMGMMKWGAVACALVAALVVWLIS
ncbi:aa3-type cytochrome c oxidase subunit IV [Sphingomonas sp.]|jgi:hypothetical protein|uniref:aa3-type cytochrome c oxidase subunit IV n=1 Tax=Sphingomonas sp. TaxID=28214 RepID=UPI002EDAADE2